MVDEPSAEIPKQGEVPKFEYGDLDQKLQEATNPPDPKIQKNIDSRKAAEQILELAEEEFGKDLNDRFWETLRDKAIEKVGMPLPSEDKKIKGMTRVQAEKFKKDIMPRGKYAGMTFGAIEEIDPDYLKRFAKEPDFHQKLVAKFVNRDPDPRKRKKE